MSTNINNHIMKLNKTNEMKKQRPRTEPELAPKLKVKQLNYAILCNPCLILTDRGRFQSNSRRTHTTHTHNTTHCHT